MRLDDIPFALQTYYIRLTAITYQSFGLDKNKALAETSALFFGTFELNGTNLMCLKSQDFLLFESILTQRTVTLCSLCPLIFYQVF